MESKQEVLAILIDGGVLIGDENLLQTSLKHLEEVELPVLEKPIEVLYVSTEQSASTVHHGADSAQTEHEG